MVKKHLELAKRHLFPRPSEDGEKISKIISTTRPTRLTHDPRLTLKRTQSRWVVGHGSRKSLIPL